MNLRYLFFCFVLFFYFNTANSQSLVKIAEKISLNKGLDFMTYDVSSVSNCNPDSIVVFYFDNQSDSTLGNKQIFFKYGDVSEAVHYYGYNYVSEMIELNAIDSTVFDNEGRPTLNEFWEYDYDSTRLVLEQRFQYYPHEGNILKDYSFFEDMLNEINYEKGEFVDYDSVIVYEKDFFTGLLVPEEKRIHVYSQEGYLKEAYEFSYAEFNMSWIPTTKQDVYYTPSSRIDKIEISDWDGISNYTLSSTSIYTYDSNDSLVSILLTNNLTGQPEQRMDMSYNISQNSTDSKVYFWDGNNNSWLEVIQIFGEFDHLDRLKILELKVDLFGTEEYRSEYVYNGDEGCPFYINAFEMDGGIWNFYGRIYFYPFIFTSIYEIDILEWSAYPNPTNDGIWVEAPIGSKVQIATLVGTIIYKGQITDEREFISLNQINTQVILTIQNDSSISSRLIFVNK